MRKITTHNAHETEEGLTITTADSLTEYGTNNCYTVKGFSTETNRNVKDNTDTLTIVFQDGAPHPEWNGITMECLLAIVADRLDSFQAGEFPSEYNNKALHHTREALQCLHDRMKSFQ